MKKIILKTVSSFAGTNAKYVTVDGRVRIRKLADTLVRMHILRKVADIKTKYVYVTMKLTHIAAMLSAFISADQEYFGEIPVKATSSGNTVKIRILKDRIRERADYLAADIAGDELRKALGI